MITEVLFWLVGATYSAQRLQTVADESSASVWTAQEASVASRERKKCEKPDLIHPSCHWRLARPIQAPRAIQDA